MSNVTALRMRVLPRFPARIVGTDGDKVERQGVDLIVRPDYGQLSKVADISDPLNTYFRAWASVDESYTSISFQDLVDGIGGIIIGPTLASINGLTTATNKGMYFTAPQVAATYDLSAFVRGISGSADAAGFRTALGLDTAATQPSSAFATAAQGTKADSALQPTAIGTSVQAYDAALQSISGLTTSADLMIYATGADTYATTALTAFARTILDDTTAAAMKTTLGLAAVASSGSAADLGTGLLPEARLPTYTGPYFATVTDCNTVLKGGRYYVPTSTPNSPSASFDFWMEAISDGFTFVQRAHQRAIPSPTTPPKKFEREYYAGVFGDWKPIVDTKLELDATYLKLASRGYVDLKTDFGTPGVGDDYTNPWNDFLDACLFDSKKGKIPNGTFNVSQPETRTCTAPFQSITIEGAGRQTLLNFRGELGAALTLNYQTVFNSFNLSHLNVQTDSETTAMSAFRLLSPAYGDPAAAEYNIFDDVVFKGLDGYKVSDHWKTAVYGYRTNNIVFDNCRFIGPGTPIGDPNGRGNLIELQSATGDYCVKHTFNNCFFSQFENAILVGEYVQGIVVNGSDFVGGRCGVYVPAGQHANDGLLVTGGHMNTRVAGIEVLATEATSMEVANTFFIIDKVNQVGIRTAGYRWSVTNTHFQGQGTVTGAAGVQAISGSHHGIITANQYGFMPSGNVLNSGSHDILVVNNRYESVTTPNVNNGTNNTIGAATA